jgi:type II secretory pathway pseudopilin PulG
MSQSQDANIFGAPFGAPDEADAQATVHPRTQVRMDARSGGFSLIDLLVSMSVMGVLIAILLPSLTHAQEAARRVKCASNTRQIGLALQAYAYEHKDQLPPLFSNTTSTATNTIAQSPSAQLAPTTGMTSWSNDSMYVRWTLGSTTGPAVWDGLGILFARGYIEEPGLVYCPSHHGRHSFSEYATQWSTRQGTIASNYQYRVPNESRYLSALSPRASFLADGLQTKSDYNHETGNNFLRADLSVLWYHDVNGELLSTLPDDNNLPPATRSLNRGWDIFDDVLPPR